MVVLKKVRAATLVETLVASAIIMVVFLIASMSLNNVFLSGIKNNESVLNNRIKELTYLTKYQKINIPFYQETLQYDIVIEKRDGELIVEALHKPSGKLKTVLINEGH